MIRHITDETYLTDFVEVYNSAIELFEEQERGLATIETFLPQLKQDENFAEIGEDGTLTGFFSYHRNPPYYELTSLYVKRALQRQGIGHRLLDYFEKQVQNDGIIFVKVLKNAPWSLEFYRKHDYKPLKEDLKEIAETLGLSEKAWSMTLFKISHHESDDCTYELFSKQ